MELRSRSTSGGWSDANGMMVGPWFMGSGMFVMLGALLVVAVTIIVLALVLRRVVPGDPTERIRAGAVRRLNLPPTTQLGLHVDPPDGEIDGFLVIPDISGYTQFMQISAYALAHAQYAVSALLSSVIEAVEDVLVTAKIEGDAVFLYGVRAVKSGQGGLTGPEVGSAIGALLRAFYRKRAELRRSNTCSCEACRHVERLELKAVVHSGRLLLYDLHGQRELSGLPVIVAHRLLKSDVRLDRYVLITDAAGIDVVLPVEAERKRHIETYEGIGQVESIAYAFKVESVLVDEIQATPSAAAKAADAARKLVEGLRAVRGTVSGA